MIRACAASIAVLLLAAASCARPRHYELRGQVVSVDPARQQITIRHDGILAFMPGMTMPFRVRETAPTRDLVQPGDAVPDPPLFDEAGAPRPLSYWKGRVLAVTFTYTRCPLPNFCPLTGDQQIVDGFASRFGVSVIREDPPAREIVHNLRRLVVDADGRLVKVHSGNEWAAADLLNDLRAASARR